jgi:hypothetical protein
MENSILTFEIKGFFGFFENGLRVNRDGNQCIIFSHKSSSDVYNLYKLLGISSLRKHSKFLGKSLLRHLISILKRTFRISKP